MGRESINRIRVKCKAEEWPEYIQPTGARINRIRVKCKEKPEKVLQKH